MVINMVRDAGEGKKIYSQIQYVVGKFLPDLRLTYLGAIPYEECVKKAIKLQIPFLKCCEDSKVSAAIKEIAYKLLNIKGQRERLETFLERFSAL